MFGERNSQTTQPALSLRLRSFVWAGRTISRRCERYDLPHMHSANDISCDPQRFCKAVLVAKLVKHDNVLAIEGAQVIDGSKFFIVSEWMEHGNMHTYLKNNEAADRAELVSPTPHPRYPISDSLEYSCSA